MTDIFYDIDAGAPVTSSGAMISRVPELFYQEHTAWRIVLKHGSTAADISGVAAWGAAVAADFCAGTPPMCRTLSSGIVADAATGVVTVELDAATPEFLAVVNGTSVKPAWFELYGLGRDGRRAIHVMFEIRARMTLDPDPAVDTETPETVATKDFTALAISSALENYPTSSGAKTIASNAAQRATSGAIFSGAEIDTQIGDYRITATSGGGVTVSGLGASVTLSGGQIAASATDGEDREAHVTITSGGIDVGVGDPTNTAGVAIASGVVAVNTTEFDAVNGIIVNGRPVATAPVTSTDSATTSAHIEVLTGGTIYKFTQPLEVLSIGSATETTNADYVRFTLAPGAAVDIPADVEVIASGLVFDAGGKYLLRFFDGTMTADFDVERPVANSTGAWYKSGAAVLASGMALADITVSGGETLNVYDRGWALRAVVNSGGTMNISSGGIGRNILTAYAGGRVNVSAGGVMSGVTLSGGPVTVSVGGAVAGAYIHSGNLGVFGTAEDVVLYAGENLRVYPGGVISNMTVMSGVAYISSGGAVAGVIVSGGVVAPLAGASVTDVIIRGGAQYVSGIVSNITISGGMLRVFSGGSALAVTSLGGAVVVSSGGYVEYTE